MEILHTTLQALRPMNRTVDETPEEKSSALTTR